LEALAEELPIDTIRFSSKLTSIKTQAQKGSSHVVLIEMEDGTTIKAKVRTINFSVYWRLNNLAYKTHTNWVVGIPTWSFGEAGHFRYVQMG
jgi:hypothetical protein